MPFDGKNFTETKPDVFSLEGLIAWLEKQPAATAYYCSDASSCLLAKYIEAMGGTGDGPMHLVDASGRKVALFRLGDDNSRHPLWQAASTPGMGQLDTYGAALDRAIALRRAETGEV